MNIGLKVVENLDESLFYCGVDEDNDTGPTSLVYIRLRICAIVNDMRERFIPG